MNIHAHKRMTVDEYLAWAADRPGRYELIDGVVRQMSPETSGHADAKQAAVVALKAAIRRARLSAFAKPDGMTVRISDHVAFEPDALVYMAPRVDDASLEIPNPIIIVEVTSPSTRKYDAGFKLEGYMSLPSVHHILLVSISTQVITHYRRVSTAEFLATAVSQGVLKLDPPGIEMPVADFFATD
ncbi:MAG: Uma2 family endonuclease [Hyphomicrobium sp.]